MFFLRENVWSRQLTRLQTKKNDESNREWNNYGESTGGWKQLFFQLNKNIDMHHDYCISVINLTYQLGIPTWHAAEYKGTDFRLALTR